MSVLTPIQRYEFRKIRTRRNILGTAARPRLSVSRTSKHVYLQIVDDVRGHTLVAASTLDADVKKSIKTGANIQAAKVVGKFIAEKAKVAGIKKVVFDRGGSPYHGRIQAVADGAREAGLEF